MLCFYFWMMVQILLESFPVSSSGHCLLLEKYLNTYAYAINHCVIEAQSVDSASGVTFALLDHFVHGVTVLVLALFFFSRWSWLVMHLRVCWKIILKIVGLTFVADLITALFYLLFNCYQVSIPLALGFMITAGVLLSLRLVPARSVQKFDLHKACMLGVVQGCALLPGVSRFASTYACARWLGLPSHKAFEVSWLIAWPLIAAAFVHSAALISITSPDSVLLQPTTFVVMIAAGIAAFYALRWVRRVAYRGQLWLFGLYMVAPIVCALLV